jgi:hypothetical protein
MKWKQQKIANTKMQLILMAFHHAYTYIYFKAIF